MIGRRSLFLDLDETRCGSRCCRAGKGFAVTHELGLMDNHGELGNRYAHYARGHGPSSLLGGIKREADTDGKQRVLDCR
jgi:hypothetical protein